LDSLIITEYCYSRRQKWRKNEFFW